MKSLNQLIDNLFADPGLVCQDDQKGFGFFIHSHQPLAEGGTHAFLVSGIDHDLDALGGDLFPDPSSPMSQHQNDLIHLRMEKLIQNMLQNGLPLPGQQYLGLAHAFGLASSENDGGDH